MIWNGREIKENFSAIYVSTSGHFKQLVLYSTQSISLVYST